MGQRHCATQAGGALGDEEAVSTELPEFATRLDKARYLVRENRLHELWFEDLDPDACEIVLRDLRAKLSRVRRRSLRAHIIGVLQGVCFLGLGAVLMARTRLRLRIARPARV